MKKDLSIFWPLYLAAIAFVGALAVLPSCTTSPTTPGGGTTEPPVSADAAALRAKVTDIAVGDLCAQTAHDEQGKPPARYLKGIALTYARAVCNPDWESTQIASQPVGSASNDFMAHYGLSPATPSARLNTTYALLLGSAARESSWRWCVGRDTNATNLDAETAEAGLYQTSYNSRVKSPALPKLFAQFKASSAGCFAEEYKGGTTCSEGNMKNWGSGEGVEFQRLSKECPGFASEYHSVMVRVNRSHYGPINTKRSEAKPVCVGMFERIRKVIVADPRICGAL